MTERTWFAGLIPDHYRAANRYDRLYVTIRLETHSAGPELIETVDHEHVQRAGLPTLSITGEVVANGRRLGTMRDGDVTSAGQVLYALDDAIRAFPHTPSRPDPDVASLTLRQLRTIKDLWTNYHLNHMSAACAHMPRVFRYNDRTSLTSPNLPTWEDRPTCPLTGYRYGNAWLYRPLPPAVLESAAFFASVPAPAPAPF